MDTKKEARSQMSLTSVLKRVWGLFKPFHRTIYVTLFLQLVILCFEFLAPYVYGLVIDSISQNKPIDVTINLVAISFVISLLVIAMNAFKSQYEIRNFDLDASRHINDQTVKRLFSFSVGQHRNEHTGMVQGVINDGRSAINEIFFTGMNQALPVMLSLPVAAVAVLWLSVPVGSIVVVGMILFFWSTMALNKKFRLEIRKNHELSRQVGKRTTEILRNAPTVILSAEENRSFNDIHERMLDRDNKAKHIWSRFLLWSNARTTIIEVFTAMALVLAAYMVADNTLRVGAVVTLMIWVGRVFSDVATVGRMSRVLLEARERALKYFRMFDVESDVPISKNPITIKHPKGEIEFKDVFFTYSTEKINKEDEEENEEKPHQALGGISFKISPGEKIAFVGKSGSGKSTTAMLLLRGQDPSPGDVFIDGINLKDLDLESYRRAVGVVEQNIILFDDTMRYNISYGLGENRLLSDEELDEIAKTTRIDQFKDRLTNGWDTVIGENGVKLSGGERQRVGIARALAKNPSILVFDEATSSLDPENERLIKEAIDKVSEGRTVISIAHRLSTILNADRIFVFEKGKIVDVGTHEELLKRSPAYQVQVSGQTVVV